jgi:hypothetical protein
MKEQSLTLRRVEKHLMLNVAFIMLKIDPTVAVREELCELCVTMNDILATCVAMRDAAERPSGPSCCQEHDRTSAALRLLRARKAARQHGGNA